MARGRSRVWSGASATTRAGGRRDSRTADRRPTRTRRGKIAIEVVAGPRAGQASSAKIGAARSVEVGAARRGARTGLRHAGWDDGTGPDDAGAARLGWAGLAERGWRSGAGGAGLAERG
ncbi:hypothetical protein [Crossiella cryophila]|uniref:Uncharacterized protein n=1 Tax=Crossiella cryophila TaxID=43355 RepID=A0A7W7CD81_9PSEU|nr:hypothetical protein [Crossiella cryophila]MBB4678902.1 hypothetical protein [Crossiella cryophila]